MIEQSDYADSVRDLQSSRGQDQLTSYCARVNAWVLSRLPDDPVTEGDIAALHSPYLDSQPPGTGRPGG